MRCLLRPLLTWGNRITIIAVAIIVVIVLVVRTIVVVTMVGIEMWVSLSGL